MEYFLAGQQVTPVSVKEALTASCSRDTSLVRLDDLTNVVDSARDYCVADVTNSALYDSSTLRLASLKTTIRPFVIGLNP